MDTLTPQKKIIKNKKILVIDETIREGMQHRGLVLSQNQREKIIEFQENLKVDICQAGYPTSHESEFDA
jgi:isopropylmalate/homocitrate/citramalate synthase